MSAWIRRQYVSDVLALMIAGVFALMGEWGAASLLVIAALVVYPLWRRRDRRHA